MVEASAITIPVSPAYGATPTFVLPRFKRPAGVTSRPNVASVRNGVRTQRFVIYFPPGNNADNRWSTVGLMALPSSGAG